MKLTEEQKNTLTQAMVSFSLRVLDGKQFTMQETAVLPSVLSILMAGEKLDK